MGLAGTGVLVQAYTCVCECFTRDRERLCALGRLSEAGFAGFAWIVGMGLVGTGVLVGAYTCVCECFTRGHKRLCALGRLSEAGFAGFAWIVGMVLAGTGALVRELVSDYERFTRDHERLRQDFVCPGAAAGEWARVYQPTGDRGGIFMKIFIKIPAVSALRHFAGGQIRTVVHEFQILGRVRSGVGRPCGSGLDGYGANRPTVKRVVRMPGSYELLPAVAECRGLADDLSLGGFRTEATRSCLVSHTCAELSREI